MSLNFSNLSRKQIAYFIIGALLFVGLLLLVGIYGNFAKTQVNPSSATYSGNGAIKSQLIQDPGTYKLTFRGQNRDGTNVEVSREFQVAGNATPTPVLSTTPTPALTSSATPTPAVSPSALTTPTPTFTVTPTPVITQTSSPTASPL